MDNGVKNYPPDFWMRSMRTGAFADAWDFSDEVLRSRAGKPCWHLPRHQQYIWDGTPLHGKSVLVRCYHGLGDTIQFIRYMPLLKKVAKEVKVWAQPALIPLLKTAEGIDELWPLHDGTPEAEYEADIEIMELSHVFRTTIETIPSAIPYLHVEPLRAAPEGKMAVGLVWRAGDWDERRSMTFEQYLPFFDVKDVEFVILQEKALEKGWREGFGTHPGDQNLYDYARTINGLDLLITVDTMPAHLTGALGVPVWTLLHSEADWRWMDERLDSPWYPTMRLFRQREPGDWASVINEVISSLVALRDNR
jgi:hypothetical protein